ncbi:hypothetical protein ENUP19_0262G0009, partial [Entamoeba nuttalli]
LRVNFFSISWPYIMFDGIKMRFFAYSNLPASFGIYRIYFLNCQSNYCRMGGSFIPTTPEEYLEINIVEFEIHPQCF